MSSQVVCKELISHIYIQLSRHSCHAEILLNSGTPVAFLTMNFPAANILTFVFSIFIDNDPILPPNICWNQKSNSTQLQTSYSKIKTFQVKWSHCGSPEGWNPCCSHSRFNFIAWGFSCIWPLTFPKVLCGFSKAMCLLVLKARMYRDCYTSIDVPSVFSLTWVRV